MSTDSVSELAEIAVRVHADTAAIRYRSEIEATPAGETSWRLQLHTDVYERRGDRWQIVGSQATAIG